MDALTTFLSDAVVERNANNMCQPRRGGHFSKHPIRNYDPGFSSCPLNPGKNCPLPPSNKELGAQFVMGAAVCAEMRKRRAEHLGKIYKRRSTDNASERCAASRRNQDSEENSHLSEQCLAGLPERLDVHVSITKASGVSDQSECGVSFSPGRNSCASPPSQNPPPNVSYTMSSPNSPKISAKQLAPGVEPPQYTRPSDVGVCPPTDASLVPSKRPDNPPNHNSIRSPPICRSPSQHSGAKLLDTKNQFTETTGLVGKKRNSCNTSKKPKITVSHKTVSGCGSRVGEKNTISIGPTVMAMDCKQKGNLASYTSQKIGVPWGSLGVELRPASFSRQAGGPFYDASCYMDSPNVGDSNAGNIVHLGMPGCRSNNQPQLPPFHQMTQDPAYLSQQYQSMPIPDYSCPPQQAFQPQQVQEQQQYPCPKMPHSPNNQRPSAAGMQQPQFSAPNNFAPAGSAYKPSFKGLSLFSPETKSASMRTSAFVGPDGRELSVRRMSRMTSMLMQHRRTRPSKAVDTAFSVTRTRNCATPSRNAGVKDIPIIPQATSFSANMTLPQAASDRGHCEAILAAVENAARNEREVAANEALQERIKKQTHYQPDNRKSGV